MSEPEIGRVGHPDDGQAADGDAVTLRAGPGAGPGAGPSAASPSAAGPSADGQVPELSWVETVQVVPVVLRTGLMAGQRLVTWTVSSSALVTQWAAQNGSLGDLRGGIVASLRAALGIDELEAELRRHSGHPTPAADPAPELPGEPAPTPSPVSVPDPPSLRERGRRLLAQSTALEDDEEHPAFGSVIEQVAPDEMRLLRLFSREGDQAAVDVESAGVLAGGGRVVARRVTLLAQKAGCKHPDRLAVYLDNLERLGVVRIDDAPLGDADYEVVEAQPRIVEAREQASRGASRARLVRRRLGLTDFGKAFCETILPS